MIWLKGLSIMKWQQDDRCGEEYRGQYYGVVKKGCQAAQHARRIAVRNHEGLANPRFQRMSPPDMGPRVTLWKRPLAPWLESLCMDFAQMIDERFFTEIGY